jgi:uncharacterized protein (DUF2384 family)
MKRYESLDKEKAILEEPAVAYGSVNYFAMANSMITKDYIKKILIVSKLSLAELMEIIPISIDTYKRKTSFGSSVTEKILEVEEVYHKGLNAFGDSFHLWMNADNVALDGLVPKKLLANSFGVRKLLEQIGRMEHGVLA